MANVEPKYKYTESGVSYDSLAAVVHQLTGVAGYEEFIRRLVAMLIVGNTDAHLKNWALNYADGRTPALAPVYDFHSLTVYSRYRYAQLALSLNNGRLPTDISLDDFRRLADQANADPVRTVDVVIETVQRLRDAWTGGVGAEVASRFAALSEHFTHRLATLPICTAGA